MSGVSDDLDTIQQALTTRGTEEELEAAFDALSRVRQDLAGWEAARDEIENRWRALGNLADEADSDGDHVGFARRYRALQDGIAEAHRLLEDRTRAALAKEPAS